MDVTTMSTAIEEFEKARQALGDKDVIKSNLGLIYIPKPSPLIPGPRA